MIVNQSAEKPQLVDRTFQFRGRLLWMYHRQVRQAAKPGRILFDRLGHFVVRAPAPARVVVGSARHVRQELERDVAFVQIRDAALRTVFQGLLYPRYHFLHLIVELVAPPEGRKRHVLFDGD